MERTILVCDDCGRPAAGTLKLSTNGKTLGKDLCSKDMESYLAGAHKLKRGRRPGTVATK